MLVGTLRRIPLVRYLVHRLAAKRAAGIFERISPFVTKNEKILDLGVGTCNVPGVFINNGFKVTPLDIENLSFYDKVEPIIYDGKKIPFSKNYFDTTFILSILHHISNQQEILKEAKRVSRKFVIREDIFENKLQKYLTYFLDSLLNLEFIGHPHTNRTDKEWRELFAALGFNLISTQHSRSFFFFNQVTYYLTK